MQFPLLDIALKQKFPAQRNLLAPAAEVPTRTVAWQVRQIIMMLMSISQPLPCRLSPVGWVLGQQPAERPNCIQFQQVKVMSHLTSLNSFINASGRHCNGCRVKPRMELRQAAATSPSLWWTWLWWGDLESTTWANLEPVFCQLTNENGKWIPVN